MKTALVIIGILIAIALGATSLAVNLGKKPLKGVGIASVENVDNSAVITLTDGNYYVLALPQGRQGIAGIGINGINGKDGTNGKDGKNGANGVNGIAGKDGVQGIQGLTGTVGATGFTGATGSQGIQGLAGATGVTGVQGIQGVAGTSVEYRAGTGTFTIADGVGTCIVVFSTPLSTVDYSIAILGNDRYVISNQTVDGFTVTSSCAPFVWFAIVNK